MNEAAKASPSADDLARISRRVKNHYYRSFRDTQDHPLVSRNVISEVFDIALAFGGAYGTYAPSENAVPLLCDEFTVAVFLGIQVAGAKPLSPTITIANLFYETLDTDVGQGPNPTFLSFREPDDVSAQLNSPASGFNVTFKPGPRIVRFRLNYQYDVLAVPGPQPPVIMNVTARLTAPFLEWEMLNRLRSVAAVSELALKQGQAPITAPLLPSVPRVPRVLPGPAIAPARRVAPFEVRGR